MVLSLGRVFVGWLRFLVAGWGGFVASFANFGLDEVGVEIIVVFEEFVGVVFDER